MSGNPDPGTVVVWGNCQAEPVADLLAPSLAEHGLHIVSVPPVFEVDEAGLALVHHVVSGAAVLVTQPVRDEYRIPGCGADQLAALLPAGARVVRFPVTFHTGPFPYQVHGHGADGERVDAPLTDYHDLRLLVAADRRLSDDAVAAWWPGSPAPPATLRTLSDASVSELRRREEGLDVVTSDQVTEPGAMFTMSHPANRILRSVAEQILQILGITNVAVVSPEREFLGAVRTPVDRNVARSVKYGTGSSCWRIGGRDVAWEEVARAHLALYRDRPDVVADARIRHADRIDALGL